MTTAQFSIVNLFKNHGHNAEYAAGLFFGVEAKPNNTPHTKAGDVCGWQVKSARATVCDGSDIDAYLAADAADGFIYVAKTFKAYFMSRAEYAEFLRLFSYAGLSSKKNGEKPVLRLKSESRRLIEWLETAIA